MNDAVRQVCRRAAAVLLLGAAAAGCGIRPTSVPVDAGAPASRTACPPPTPVMSPSGSAPTSPLNAPFAAKQPEAGVSPTAFGPTAPPTANPTATPSCLQTGPGH
ncbi:hypothetical protein [Peterkaempfera bronchialis]|uniref:Uncharacterized protein n=1 Tax=Peterkaempfera bronchialis TaxID=2126346 RepID=A0A345SVZ6_9ACTN|nr:hypothetical protein [Peterkaempfera bronchialis]AXI77901.1 hypothetical protein C7M71_011090 [Peterkaempfera bronchialis]